MSAFRLITLASVLILVCGCTSLPHAGSTIGNETAPGWMRQSQQLAHSDARHLRGYHKVTRHWFVD